MVSCRSLWLVDTWCFFESMICRELRSIVFSFYFFHGNSRTFSFVAPPLKIIIIINIIIIIIIIIIIVIIIIIILLLLLLLLPSVLVIWM